LKATAGSYFVYIIPSWLRNGRVCYCPTYSTKHLVNVYWILCTRLPNYIICASLMYHDFHWLIPLSCFMGYHWLIHRECVLAGLRIMTDRPTDHAIASVTSMYIVLRCSLKKSQLNNWVRHSVFADNSGTSSWSSGCVCVCTCAV